MVKLLLLMPKCQGPGNGKRWNTEWSAELEERVWKAYWKVYTPSLLVLAAIAKEFQIEIDVVDEEFANVSTNKVYNLVAISSITPNAKRCYEWSKMFQAQGSYVVIGGVHATVCPDEVREHCDSILIGECEYIWREFLSDFMRGAAQREYKQATGTVDLQQSPIPAYELLPANYANYIPVQTSRGCNRGCVFCNVKGLYGDKYRYKTIESVEQEISYIVKLFGRAKIYITDDNFFSNPGRAVKILDILKKYSLSWCANTDATFGHNLKLIKRAYESGCRCVLIGFESVSEEALKGIDSINFKHSIYDSYEKIISTIQGCGIGVCGSFMVGHDSDVEDTYRKLANFIQKNGLYGVNITVRTPYPGTSLFSTMREKGKILTYDWNQYTIFQPILRTDNFSAEQVQSHYQELLNYVYSPEATAERLNVLKNQMRENSNQY